MRSINPKATPPDLAQLTESLSLGAFSYSQHIESCSDLVQLGQLFQDAIRPLGMTASASGMVSGPRSIEGLRFHFLNWPADWLALYESQAFLEKDPAPRWAIMSGAPIVWTELMAKLPPDDPGHEVYARASEWKFTEGLVTPVRGRDGSLGLVSVGGNRARLLPHEQLFLQSISIATLHRAEAIADLAPQYLGLGSLNLAAREHLTLDPTGQARLVVGATGWIHHANPAAERLLKNGMGICSREGHLTLVDMVASEQLRSLIRSADAGGPGPARAGVMTYLADDGRSCASITVEPMGEAPRMGVFGQATVLVHITFAQPDKALDEAAVRGKLGLTAAEWRIAAALYQGQSLQGVAAATNISINTVRGQLRNIFAKTNTHRQTELMALIRSLLPGYGNTYKARR